jgi:hypothetical protein
MELPSEYVNTNTMLTLRQLRGIWSVFEKLISASWLFMAEANRRCQYAGDENFIVRMLNVVGWVGVWMGSCDLGEVHIQSGRDSIEVGGDRGETTWKCVCVDWIVVGREKHVASLWARVVSWEGLAQSFLGYQLGWGVEVGRGVGGWVPKQLHTKKNTNSLPEKSGNSWVWSTSCCLWVSSTFVSVLTEGDSRGMKFTIWALSATPLQVKHARSSE